MAAELQQMEAAYKRMGETQKAYLRYLNRFLNYHRNEEEPARPQHYKPSNDELHAITPEHIERYLNYITFNSEEPEKGDEGQAEVIRASTAEFYKKAILYYIPNRLMGWNEQK
jgi:hypothetical protein